MQQQQQQPSSCPFTDSDIIDFDTIMINNNNSEVRGYHFYRQKHPLLTLLKDWPEEFENLFVEFYEHERTNERTGQKERHEIILWFVDDDIGPCSFKSKDRAIRMFKGSTDWVLKRQLKAEDFEPLHRQFADKLMQMK